MRLPLCRLLRSGVGLVLIALSSLVAHAEGVSERQVIADLTAGRFEELRSIEAKAQAGDPVAMHWWAVLIDACAIDGCRRDEADAWWRKAALAGHGRSRALVYLRRSAEATAQDPYMGIGEPRTSEEKLMWAGGILASAGTGLALRTRALDTLQAVDAAEPTMLSLQMSLLQGRNDQIAVARTMLAAGTPSERLVGEVLRRQYLVRERKRYPEVLAMAQGNDRVAAVALCASTDVMDGHSELPPALYPLCVAAFESGHLGLAAVLLRHHLARDETEAAGRYANWCARLPVSCTDSLIEYEKRRLGNTPAWREREAEIALADGRPAAEDMPLQVRQRGLAMKVRRLEAQRACLRRPHDRNRGSFAPDADCPWGKPPG